MKDSDVVSLYRNSGLPIPPGLVCGPHEKIKNTKRKTVDSIEFRSTLEADVYVLLKSWERADAIRNLKCQPKYLLQTKMRVDGRTQRAITYIADFQFERIRRGVVAGWETVVIDAKGHRMEVYKLKVKLFRAKFPEIVFEEWNRETLKANGG